MWGWRWLDELGRGARHAARSLARSPGFAATAVLVLALGIGASTAMFSIVYGMLIPPLPYPDAGAIVRITESIGPRPSSTIVNASLEAIVEEAESFEQIAAYGPSSIGIRMALGAGRGDILGLVVRQGAMLVAAGAVVGLAGAAASSRVLESFLYGATDDRLTFVAAPLVLAAVALFACWLPARRATRVDPMEVLRLE